MNHEIQLLKALLDKKTYDKYSAYIKPSQVYKKHYALLAKMHENTEESIKIQDYLTLVSADGLGHTDDILETDISESTVQQLLTLSSERGAAHKLGVACMEVYEGRRPFSELLELYDRVVGIAEQSNDDGEYITGNLEALAEDVHGDVGLQWRLPALQEALGGLNKGDFGFIYARPETGKTTFLASEVSKFAEQVRLPVLWFNNEERGQKVMSRIIQATLGLTEADMFSNLVESQQEYDLRVNGNIRLYDKGYIHKRDVEAALKKEGAGLVVFDQIDKIKGFKADREDLMLGAIYQWARELAKQYCPVIGVCQAAASAENKRWLTQDDVAKSKTEKAAEGDFMLGIGKRHDVGMENVRFINIVKNKLRGSHAKIQCTIKPEIARYE